jgi:predicted kinase
VRRDLQVRDHVQQSDANPELASQVRCWGEGTFRLLGEVGGKDDGIDFTPPVDSLRTLKRLPLTGISPAGPAIAEALAPLVEGPVVSADATRKYLAGIEKVELGDPSIYTTAFTQHVHEELLRRASQVLRSGRPVVLDTTFKSRQLRGRARRLAERMKAPFVMIECCVPETVARERLRGRKLGVSDAREDLLNNFLRDYEPMTELAPGELVRLDGTRSEGEILDELSRREVIDTRPGGERP